MGRDNFGSVNISHSLKPRIKAAAKLLDWSERQVADMAISYALDMAATPDGKASECKLVRMLAMESWGSQPYGDAGFAAERPSSGRERPAKGKPDARNILAPRTGSTP